jgi:hypothetical protein
MQDVVINMRYVIYKITNNINGRYYIGRHATKNINDDYMGSGKAIKGMLELWNPKATATNKNQKEYKSGDCKRAKIGSSQYANLIEQGWLPIERHKLKNCV